MVFFKSLFGDQKNSDTFSDGELVEAGVCPNCWGTQEYEDEYLAYEADQTKSNVNKDKRGKKAFIQQFVETNVTGIQLKKEGMFHTCAACKTKYKHTK